MDVVFGSNDIGNLTAGSAFRTRTTPCAATQTRSPPSTAKQTVCRWLRLYAEVVRPLATPETPGAFYRRMRLVGIDGTVMDVPDRDANQVFGRSSGSRGDADTKSSSGTVRITVNDPARQLGKLVEIRSPDGVRVEEAAKVDQREACMRISLDGATTWKQADVVLRFQALSEPVRIRVVKRIATRKAQTNFEDRAVMQ